MFGLSNSSGSFGSVCLAEDMGSSSVRVLFDSHVSVQCSQWLSLGSV